MKTASIKVQHKNVIVYSCEKDQNLIKYNICIKRAQNNNTATQHAQQQQHKQNSIAK